MPVAKRNFVLTLKEVKMASIWNIIHILLLSLSPLASAGMLGKRLNQGSEEHSSVCERIHNLNQETDKKILEFIGEVENLRTGCICGLNKQVGEKLAVLKNDLANLRDGCVCEPQTSPSGCEEGWTEFQGSCFLFQMDNVNWYQAKEKCNGYGKKNME